MQNDKDDEYPKEWTSLGTAADRLLGEAEAMYWRSMKLEIASVIHTLHELLQLKPQLEELVENDASYLDLTQRLSLRIVPYVKAWCQIFWPSSLTATNIV